MEDQPSWKSDFQKEEVPQGIESEKFCRGQSYTHRRWSLAQEVLRLREEGKRHNNPCWGSVFLIQPDDRPSYFYVPDSLVCCHWLNDLMGLAQHEVIVIIFFTYYWQLQLPLMSWT